MLQDKRAAILIIETTPTLRAGPKVIAKRNLQIAAYHAFTAV